MSSELLLVLDALPDSQRPVLTDNRFSKQPATGATPIHDHSQQTGTTVDPTSKPAFESLSQSLASLNLGATRSARLFLQERLARGLLGSVYRAASHDSSSTAPQVVVKLVTGIDGVALLRHEAIIYQQATRLQGVVIPIFYGFYVNSSCDIAFLLLEDCGRPLSHAPDFATLPLHTKLSVMQALKRLHDEGLEHGDLQPWNVLEHHGELRLVGLNLAMFHACPARGLVMTEEYCFREAVAELVCEELAAVGEEMGFASQDEMVYM